MVQIKSAAAKPESVLPDRIIQLTENAPYAPLVVRCVADRAAFLPEILSLHTKQELSEIPGLGKASIATIEAWLAQHGRRLRMPGESLDTVICHFGARRKYGGEHKLGARLQSDGVDVSDHRP
ncbi:hypothetical protein [Bradyrhizobium sp. 170]|uniref:hypothetical protein n=1 Tax=Bradyrhizobium sp. 170 TaxID=2782641 RepID=UPI001FFEBBCF|nr:hypothetical protein [Bradyrhizobium sp. 170]UPK01084.1 hypothetical protein IVB05_25680 [Bradyrhizobium sp. 170]